MPLSTLIRELLQGRNILLADDTVLIRNLLKEILILLGADGRIDEAADGLRAWNLLQETSYGLVIADIMMPHMDGRELQRRVRYSSQHRDIPILLTSGEVSKQAVELAFRSKLDAFLNKPFTIKALEKSLWKILKQEWGESLAAGTVSGTV
jgi:CheY-like chemotaxis protein